MNLWYKCRALLPFIVLLLIKEQYDNPNGLSYSNSFWASKLVSQRRFQRVVSQAVSPRWFLQGGFSQAISEGGFSQAVSLEQKREEL